MNVAAGLFVVIFLLAAMPAALFALSASKPTEHGKPEASPDSNGKKPEGHAKATADGNLVEDGKKKKGHGKEKKAEMETNDPGGQGSVLENIGAIDFLKEFAFTLPPEFKPSWGASRSTLLALVSPFDDPSKIARTIQFEIERYPLVLIGFISYFKPYKPEEIDLTPAGLAAKRLTLVSAKKKYVGTPGLIYEFTETTNGSMMYKWIAVMGNASQLSVVSVIAPQSLRSVLREDIEKFLYYTKLVEN